MKSIAKQLLLPLFFVMVALSRAYAGVADDIAVLEDQRIAAYLVSDAASLEKIFADEMTYVHSSGIADTKRKVIDSFISGDLKIYKFDREQMMTREMGDLVLATAVGNVQLTM
ncbi:MAG: nuclear transport factor 2 family protein [Burkholderiales bacterium]